MQPKKTLINLALSAVLAFGSSAIAANLQDGVVAVVNDEIILQSELDAAVVALSAQLKAQGQQPSTLLLPNQALDLLINRKLQLGIIKRANVTPNETVINRQLLQIAQSEGYKGLGEFQESLDKKQKGAYAALRAELIEEASLAALWQNQMANRINISNSEIDAFLASPEGKALNQDEYRTTHIRVPFVEVSSRLTAGQRQEAVKIAEKIVTALKNGTSPQNALESAKGDYPAELQIANTGYHRPTGLPKEVANIITAMRVGDVSSPIVTKDGVDVIMLTDKRAGGAVIIPEWDTSHILIKVDSVQSPTIAKQKIDDIYQSLQQGASFEALAATYSDDSVSASQNGSLGWVSEGQMVPEFEQVMKKTTKGDYSIPFTTQFGYHILKVNNTRDRDVSQEYRRAAAEEILTNRLAPQAQEDWLQELRAAAYIKIIK